MESKDYRTPFGVFVKGEYSCAEATRALGLVLTCVGYVWKHVNENQYSHQWIELNMDGQSVAGPMGRWGWPIMGSITLIAYLIVISGVFSMEYDYAALY